MKKGVLVIIGLIVIGVAAFALTSSKDNNKKASTQNTTASNQVKTNPSKSNTKKACDVFTLADAKQLLGDNIKEGTGGAGDTESDTESVSTCVYTQSLGTGASAASAKSASLLVRASKNGAGITSNQNQFASSKSADAVQVSGYGDNAYWSPQYGQFNVLKNNNWYILSYGPATASNRTLDETKKLADLLIDKM